MSWSRRFDAPIALPDGREIETLRQGGIRADEARTTFLATTKDVFDEAATALATMALLNSPATGATIVLPNAPQPQSKLYVVLQPAVALATLTLNLPPAPADGDDLYVLSTKAITAVTPVAASGQSLINIPSPFALAAGVSQHITWSAQLSTWFRL